MLVIAALVALVVAAGAVVLVVVLGVLQRSARERSEERIGAALTRLGTRMDDLSYDLQAAIDRIHSEGLRMRAVDDLGGSLDVDEVLARTVEAAAAGHGADAVVVHATDLDGSTLVASVGVPENEAARQVVSSFAPDGRAARAVAVAYLYGDGIDPPGALRSGVAVPLTADGEHLGFLAVYSHDPAPAASQATVARLEAIARAAGPAIDTARRYREARHLADQDSLTGLSNRRSFHEALRHEVARAQRYERSLALLALDLDDFRTVNDRIGHLAADDVLAAVGRRIQAAVRGADTAYRIGGDEFAVILPESTWVDAEGLHARVAAALGRELHDEVDGVTVSAGIAELQPDDDAMSVFERADAALYRAKAQGKGTAA